MGIAKCQESIIYQRMPHFHNLELLHATYIKHTFSRHTHEGYAFGIIEQGALAFSYRGEKLIALPGHINLVIPGEAHDGYALSDAGWSYRMFYLDSSLLEQVAGEISGCTQALPFFAAGVIKDDFLARKIKELHMLLENSAALLMEQESQLLNLLSSFILRHAQQRFPLHPLGKENQSVRRAREYIEENYSQNISIQTLASLCNLSAFHLIRVFHDHFGVPPHVFQKQVRIKKVKDLLTQKMSLARIAQETGFTDQSHLTKQFKHIVGISPGQYRNSVQDFG
jgi:AraC-like DNA-binding protein